MKYLIILLVSLSIRTIGGAQHTRCLWPDGTEFITEKHTFGSYLDSLGMKNYHTFDLGSTMLVFHPLSNRLAFAWADSKADMDATLAKYSHANYLKSEDFERDFQNFRNDHEIDTSFLIRVLGEPSKREPAGELVHWYYPKANMRVAVSYFVNDVNFYDFNAASTQGFCIDYFQHTGDEYSSGFEITVENLAKKTIKYIWLTVKASNPVGDIVGTKTVRAIGPIASGRDGYYEFESVFLSKVVERLAIINIKIEYMDGSAKVIPVGMIKKITMR